MKIINLIFISIFCIPFGLKAQIQMDVIEMKLSKLQKKSWQKIITNGKDTTSIAVLETGIWDNPVIDAKLKIKNISDSIITLYPHESYLFVTYRFEGKEYRENVNFDIEPNIIIVHEVTFEEIKKTIEKLFKQGYFERIKSLDENVVNQLSLKDVL